MMQKTSLSQRQGLGALILTAIVFLGMLVFLKLVTGWGAARLADASVGQGGMQTAILANGTTSSTVFLPVAMRNFPPIPPVFGVEINRGKVDATVSRADEAGVWWVRYNGVLWSEVETVHGVRDWTKLASVENELQALAEQGLTPMVIVRGTPTWAQKVPGSYCGPIEEDALDDFASFMKDVVERYSIEPYKVKYWELWNEPDANYSLPPASPFGCWGDENDDYYGGEYYAEMLKHVYPAIKQADPTAQVMLGGLLMWCDSDDPAPAPEIGDCPSAKFLEGILRNDGGAFFDIMAYHAYPYWVPAPGNTDWDLNQIHWDHRGGVLLGKLDFIQDVFDQYSVSKPIIMNEGGLMCYSDDNDNPDCLSDDLKSAQANYVVRLYARTWANDIIGSTWYTLNGPGWRQGGLLDGNQDPRPAYNTFRFMAQLLEGASYLGQLSSGSLEGYVFYNESAHGEYRVYWTNDGSTVPLSLPAGTSAVYDKFGQDITPGGGTISVDFEPIFIETAP